MVSRQLTLTVNTPSVEEFAGRYRQYGSFARNAGHEVFELIMRPSSFVRAAVATVDLELPAVAGIARVVAPAIEALEHGKDRDNLKRFIGAAVCSLMEANGFRKTGTKRAIPHPAFSKGEFYEQIDKVHSTF